MESRPGPTALVALPGSLPSWLVAGVGLGLAATVVIAAVSVVGTRLAPDRTARARRTHDSRRRRREIRELLRHIDEPFVEGRAVAGGEVAFSLLDRDVAVTFDAQTVLALADHPVHVVLCGHELPGAALGQRLPSDVPSPIPDRPTPGPSPTTSPPRSTGSGSPGTPTSTPSTRPTASA